MANSIINSLPGREIFDDGIIQNITVDVYPGGFKIITLQINVYPEVAIDDVLQSNLFKAELEEKVIKPHCPDRKIRLGVD